jgi:Ca-activated chloride channel family protein
MNVRITSFLASCLLAFVSTVAQAALKLEVEPSQELLLDESTQTTYVRIGLSGLLEQPDRSRSPINVSLVLDRSGSMQGEKLRHAREAARLALDYLEPGDILSLVTYNNTVQVPVPATRFDNRERVEQAIDAIRAGGNTALFAGTAKGGAEVAKFKDDQYVNRVILLSDGLANVGPSTPADLRRLGRKLGGKGMSVTTIGLGLGYNEDLMVRLAEASDGNHVFAERPAELASIFANEFGELERIIAQDLLITIRCPEGVRPIRLLGRDSEVRGDRVIARLNQLVADQEKYLTLEVEVTNPDQQSNQPLAQVEVDYRDMAAGTRQQRRGQAEVKFTRSAARARESVKPKVMISVTEQIATEMDDEAIALKDEGKAEEAAEVFSRKADFLEKRATDYDSEALRSQSLFSREMEAAAAKPASPAEWTKARKAAREEQYIIRNQQTYK